MKLIVAVVWLVCVCGCCGRVADSEPSCAQDSLGCDSVVWNGQCNRRYGRCR